MDELRNCRKFIVISSVFPAPVAIVNNVYVLYPLFTGHNAGGNPLRYAAAQINHYSINSIVLHDLLCTAASTPYHEKKNNIRISYNWQSTDS